MQEQHRFAMSAGLRFAIAEHPSTIGHKLVARGHDVVDLVADMMNTARRVLFQELGDRRIFAEWLSNSILVFGRLMNTVLTP